MQLLVFRVCVRMAPEQEVQHAIPRTDDGVAAEAIALALAGEAHPPPAFTDE